MAEISYFQKYSQKENHITNNTMLMFRHLYRHAPLRFEQMLKDIISDATIDIGLLFSQQVKAENSIPDALITQKPISIFIEAKADGELYPEQIQRHAQSVVKAQLPKGSAIIIGLTKNRPDNTLEKSFGDICNDKGIHFAVITYHELLEVLHQLCATHETDLQEIIYDYESFLRSDGMLPNPYEMVVFPCGTSWDENIKYQIYYEQSSKSSKAHVPYIGIYKNKTITHIGRILGTCISRCSGHDIKFEHENGQITQADEAKIKTVINATDYYDLRQSSERYYLIDELYEVNLHKQSSGGIRGHRYFDLKSFSDEQITPNDKVKHIADKIRDASFL
jgi:hypothetical protein